MPSDRLRLSARSHSVRALALTLVAGLAAVTGAVLPASAANAALGDRGQVTVETTANLEASISNVQPGQTFTYGFLVGCDDNPCIDAALDAQLPPEFAGFAIDGLQVSPAGAPVTATLSGCVSSGTVTASCSLHADFAAALGSAGGVPVTGIPAGTTYRINVQLTPPPTLAADWPYNGVAVSETGHATATNSDPRDDTAQVTVVIPIHIAVDASKSWSDGSQLYNPGQRASFTIGAENGSNLPASSLVLQDPQVAPDGAAALDATNPFALVDYTGLCTPQVLPAGADRVQVDLYVRATPTGAWGWVSGAPAATPTPPIVTGEVGGIRLTYTSTSGATIAAGDTGSQCVQVAQRATNRTTGASLVLGAAVANTVLATVAVPGHDPATDTASATLTIGGLDVQVQAGKTITPRMVPAGGEFDVELGAKNQSNGPLTSLSITEPDPAGTAFLSADLAFDAFTSWTWPSGATGGTIVWHLDGGATSTDSLSSTGPPSVPSGTITGFDVVYTGEIAEGTSAGIGFRVRTDPGMVTSAQVHRDFPNQILVSGTNPAGTDTDTAADTVQVYYPQIELAIDKSIHPSLVTPGGTLVAELQTQTATNDARVNPTQIVVEDAWDGTAGAFWDAFEARELSFIQIPDGAKLTVQYRTSVGGGWTTLDAGVPSTSSPYSADLVARLGSAADSIVGLRFVFDDTTGSGFAQGTIVKPNVVFQALDVKRTGGGTTAAPETPVSYVNAATADGTGYSGGVQVNGDEVTDTAPAQIVSYGGGTGPGPGTVLADKSWTESLLASQSGAGAHTTLDWGVTVPGYTQVVVSDATPGAETSPATTVYQAFDLTAIDAVSFSADPLLRWDTVQSVELYNGTSWIAVAAPGGSWMSATGFKGYTLSPAQQASTTGLRITIVPNDAARSASTEPGRPAPGSGVASAATQRALHLQWKLRNVLRVPGATKWVTATTYYNEADPGVVRNDLRVAGTAASGTYSLDRSDVISLLDNPPGVRTSITATTSPGTTPTSVVVPYPGDVDPSAYPAVDFTIGTWNTVANRASYLRASAPVPCPTNADCVTPASDTDPDVFSGMTYDPATNPYERLTITGVDFSVGGLPIDPAATQVALWHYDAATGTTSVTTTTMAALDSLPAAALADVVGIGIVYRSTDPATTGGLIPQGNGTANTARMIVHTQLRATVRSDAGVPVAGGATLQHDVLSQSYDPVLAASATPNASAMAPVLLEAAHLDVTASKSISPSSILETNPGVPVTVTLGATDGAATAAPETLTIADTTAEFWGAFELTGLGAVTKPAGADLVRVDVQLDGDSAWIPGTAATAAALPVSLTLPDDLPRITGIRLVFSNSPARPFSATVPSADWAAQAVIGVKLRDGQSFPSTVGDDVDAEVAHPGFPAVDASAHAAVALSAGTPKLDVAKDPQTGGPKIVEPGVSTPWTLTFKNVGTSFITVNRVLDDLGPSLRYDGSAPGYSGTGGLPTTGVAVSQSSASNITFTFPAGSVMAPGDTYTITVGVILVPGLTPADQAVNSFLVDTDSTFAAGDCVNTSGNGQGVLGGVAANQCGTSNYVSPQAGPLLFGEKEVRGEIDGDLVDGASNLSNPDLPCSAEPGAFFRTVCVPYTVIGATDEWRIGAANTGTIAYSSLAFVDVLPQPGDRLLSTGGARGSDWRPVLDLAYGVQLASLDASSGWASDGMPAGTTSTVQVSTDPVACVGAGPSSAWSADPECSGTSWQDIDAYAGDAAAVTAIRILLDFTTSTTGQFAPGDSIHFLYRTKNVPWHDNAPTAGAVKAALGDGMTAEVAWDQVGVTAVLAGSGSRISRAPEKSGVQLATGSALVTKTVSGPLASTAPASVLFDGSCVVPDGAGGTVPVDLGAAATLSVPTRGSTRLDGIPLGASCEFREDGAVGAFGEGSRTPSGPQTIDIAIPGAVTDPVPAAQTVTVDNVYPLAPPGDPGGLASTGVDGARIGLALIAGLGLLLLGSLAALLGRLRRRR